MKTNTIVVFMMVLVVLGVYMGVSLVWSSLYQKDVFCCRQMSYVLAPFLHNLGFDVKILWGYNPSRNSGHCWLSVNGLWVDSTTLLPNGESGYVVYFTDVYPYRYAQVSPVVGK